MRGVFKAKIFLGALCFSAVWAQEDGVLDLLEVGNPFVPPAGQYDEDGTYYLEEIEVIGEYIEEETTERIEVGIAELDETTLLRFGGPSDSVLAGQELQRSLRATLGETLASQPGVSASSYSPGVSRPIIRGFDGVRVQTLLDGLTSMDLSQVSPDHGVAIDTLMADAIEIHRGPASLLYGNTAIGGAINTRTRHIPVREEGKDFEFASASGLESQGDGWHQAGRMRLQGDGWTLGGSFSEREAGDISIPGQARTEQYDALYQPRVAVPGVGEVPVENPTGVLPNSAHRSSSQSVGLLLGDPDFLTVGIAHSRFDNAYEVPYYFAGDSTDFFGDVAVDAELSRSTVRFEFVPDEAAGFIDRISLRLGTGDYHHTENFEGRDKDEGTDFTETEFEKEANEARFEVFNGTEDSLLQGVMGVQYASDRFLATRTIVPLPTPSRITTNYESESWGLFLYQKLRWGKWSLEGGVRSDYSAVLASEEGGDPLQSEGRTVSRSLSLAYEEEDLPGLDRLRVALTGSDVKRLPTPTERYAFWNSTALGRFIFGGDLDGTELSEESSRGVEATLHLERGPIQLDLAAFYYDFSNFIFLEDQRTSFILTAAYVEAPATFHGFESSLSVALLDDEERNLELRLLADMTKGHNDRLDQPLPRMPTARVGAELVYTGPRWTAFLEARHSFAQTEVAELPTPELPTEAYTMVNAGFSYAPSGDRDELECAVRLTNLLNEEARNHTSFRKDTTPLPGLGVSTEVRWKF
ncbi:MAG: TonB-dependent receptor [Verrucomicrobiota bacterium JB023]|nr:TonB-dependent receptor [Verrucomicrobiota bacterium JB023]